MTLMRPETDLRVTLSGLFLCPNGAKDGDDMHRIYNPNPTGARLGDCAVRAEAAMRTA